MSNNRFSELSYLIDPLWVPRRRQRRVNLGGKKLFSPLLSSYMIWTICLGHFWSEIGCFSWFLLFTGFYFTFIWRKIPNLADFRPSTAPTAIGKHLGAERQKKSAWELLTTHQNIRSAALQHEPNFRSQFGDFREPSSDLLSRFSNELGPFLDLFFGTKNREK